MFLNIVLPLVLADPARAASAMPSVDQIASGERIVVCSTGGLVVLDRNGRPVAADDRPGADHARVCVFCLPMMKGAADIPPLPFMAFLVPERSDQAPPPETTSPAPRSRPVGENDPRAPPSPAHPKV